MTPTPEPHTLADLKAAHAAAHAAYLAASDARTAAFLADRYGEKNWATAYNTWVAWNDAYDASYAAYWAYRAALDKELK